MGEIKKTDYFANPKKDTKKRPGRPPGRKNNKTLEAEKKMKEKEVSKAVGLPRTFIGEMLNIIARIEDEKQRLWMMGSDVLIEQDIPDWDLTELSNAIDKVYRQLSDLNEKAIYEGTDYPNGVTYIRDGAIYRSKTTKGIDNILNGDKAFRYSMLDRWRSDLDYYFGNGNRHEGILWSGDFNSHIDNMRRLYDTFGDDEKPEWLTSEDIDNYVKYNGMDGWFRSNGEWTQDGSEFMYATKSKVSKDDYIAETERDRNWSKLMEKFDYIKEETAELEKSTEVMKNLSSSLRDQMYSRGHLLDGTKRAMDNIIEASIYNAEMVEMYWNEAKRLESTVRFEKSVTFKGYNGHWTPVAKSGHYTMWQSVEMGDKAFNVITKTMKQKGTGKLIEKIAYEDVDGFEDDRAKMFKSNNNKKE